MPKKFRFTQEEHAEVIKLLDKIEDADLYRKLEVLRLKMEGYKNKEIAAITRYSASRVSALVSVYVKDGLAYFEQENRKGGNRRNLSFQDEEAFLAEFKEAASKGILVSVWDIRTAYNQRIGHASGLGTIYKILKRHGWRKIMPRSEHPKKASDEAIKASKKLTIVAGN
jgi:transposase